jgi:hypothetical protein
MKINEILGPWKSMKIIEILENQWRAQENRTRGRIRTSALLDMSQTRCHCATLVVILWGLL